MSAIWTSTRSGLRRVLIAHGEAIGRRLRADGVRARTVTLKLKLARPLGSGVFRLSDAKLLSRLRPTTGRNLHARDRITSKVGEEDCIRLAGVQVHQLERADNSQLGLFESAPGEDAKRDRLNRALDSVAQRFGDEAVTRGLAKAERAAPTRRIK